MTKQENENAEVSEQTKAEKAGSPELKALASLLRENMDFIEYCQDRPANFVLPCSGLIEAIAKLSISITEQVNESLREFHAQFDAPGDGGTP